MALMSPSFSPGRRELNLSSGIKLIWNGSPYIGSSFTNMLFWIFFCIWTWFYIWIWIFGYESRLNLNLNWLERQHLML